MSFHIRKCLFFKFFGFSGHTAFLSWRSGTGKKCGYGTIITWWSLFIGIPIRNDGSLFSLYYLSQRLEKKKCFLVVRVQYKHIQHEWFSTFLINDNQEF